MQLEFICKVNAIETVKCTCAIDQNQGVNTYTITNQRIERERKNNNDDDDHNNIL